MSRDNPIRIVVPYRLTVTKAEARIQALAASTSNIKWGLHALERMDEREIPDVEVLRTLRQGSCIEEPEQARQGEWKCKMTRKVRGSREVGVIVIIIRERSLFVKTVEWEDVQ